MKKLVENLIRLQEYDNRLNALKLQKGDLPMIIEGMEEELADKTQKATDIDENKQKLQNDRKIFEKEIEASKSQLKKYEEKLYHVQNNKEYDAISLEIDTKKVEIENLENKILQTIEEEEVLKTEGDSLNEEITKLSGQLKEQRGELAEINKHTQEEEDRLTHEREKLAKNLDDRHLRMYERIRIAKDGLAVAPIQRNSCSGCFSAIPPQRIIEVRKKGRLLNCEYCGRILVWTGDD